MTLQLDRYQSPLPYPEVRAARPNQELAALLMEGYCGGTSEMTTVAQYNYHSLCCQARHGEIARTMRGIFHVETLHLQYLGDCVRKLGSDPRYLLALREKTVCWQGSLVVYGSSPAKMLQADLQGEREAVAFYEQAAAKAAAYPEIASLLARLAEDEKLHVHILSELYRKSFQR